MVRFSKRAFKKWQLPLTLVLFLTGVLLMLALRSLANSDSAPWRQKNENLVNLIKTQEYEISGIERDIGGRRNFLNSVRVNSVSDKKRLGDLQNQIKQLNVLAGFTEAQGPGVIISLDDNRKEAEAAQARKPGQFKAEDYLIHYTHLLYIVNELRVGGAEAISINDQRVVGSSDIRCAGPMILVNTTRLAPPYIIRAIGYQDNLIRLLELPESEYNILKMAGYPVSIEQNPLLLLPAYKGSYQFTYAHPKEE